MNIGHFYEIATDAWFFCTIVREEGSLGAWPSFFVPVVSVARSLVLSWMSRSLNFKLLLNARILSERLVLASPLSVVYRAKLALLRCVLCVAEILISLGLGVLWLDYWKWEQPEHFELDLWDLWGNRLSVPLFFPMLARFWKTTFKRFFSSVALSSFVA